MGDTPERIASFASISKSSGSDVQYGKIQMPSQKQISSVSSIQFDFKEEKSATDVKMQALKLVSCPNEKIIKEVKAEDDEDDEQFNLEDGDASDPIGLQISMG